MSTIALDIPTFRSLFPAYSSSGTYTDGAVTLNWDASTDYISAEDYGYLSGSARSRAIYLLTAHFFFLSDLIANGQTPGMVSGSSIDKISVTLTPPPIKNQFHWWLGLSPYGQQLLALLQVKAKGGLYIGGNAERVNFRRSDGSF